MRVLRIIYEFYLLSCFKAVAGPFRDEAFESFVVAFAHGVIFAPQLFAFLVDFVKTLLKTEHLFELFVKLRLTVFENCVRVESRTVIDVCAVA